MAGSSRGDLYHGHPDAAQAPGIIVSFEIANQNRAAHLGCQSIKRTTQKGRLPRPG